MVHFSKYHDCSLLLLPQKGGEGSTIAEKTAPAVTPDQGGEARWRVTALACAQLPLRLLGLLAQQDYIPRHVSISQRDEMLDIVMAADGLSEHRARIIREKMHSVIGVFSAELDWAAERRLFGSATKA